MARIMLIVPYGKYFIHFQADLLKSLVGGGHEVIAAAPDVQHNLVKEGVVYKRTPVQNTGLNPFYDLYCFYKMISLLKKERPDIVCCYSLKPNLYGSIAANVVGVNNIYLFVTGLGYIFTAKTIKSAMLYPFITGLYALAIRYCTNIFFENKDDIALFERIHMPLQRKAVLVNGTGVNLQKFCPPYTPQQSKTFLLVARMLKDKGVVQFVQAARLLKEKYPEALFQLLGPIDCNPSAIAEVTIREWVRGGYVQYLGETDDVRPYLERATVFVLPSFYREGIPKSILEAMAVGLPIITTDSPGCRETVREEENGILVPPQDVVSLVNAMERFILDKNLARRMGIRSRKLAEQNFDVEQVNRSICKVMGLATPDHSRNS